MKKLLTSVALLSTLSFSFGTAMACPPQLQQNTEAFLAKVKDTIAFGFPNYRAFFEQAGCQHITADFETGLAPDGRPDRLDILVQGYKCVHTPKDLTMYARVFPNSSRLYVFETNDELNLPETIMGADDPRIIDEYTPLIYENPEGLEKLSYLLAESPRVCEIPPSGPGPGPIPPPGPGPVPPGPGPHPGPGPYGPTIGQEVGGIIGMIIDTVSGDDEYVPPPPPGPAPGPGPMPHPPGPPPGPHPVY